MFTYLIVKEFIDHNGCIKMVNKINHFYKKGFNLPPDTQCPLSIPFYGIFNDESKEFLPIIEKLVGKKLYPTYTYARIYKKGEMLLPHTDRNECEYSFTLALDYDNHIWPIYLQDNGEGKEIFLERGDILIYKGTDIMHWRMQLETEFQYQCFFHYVDQNGPYSNYRFDGNNEFASTDDVIKELSRKRNVF